MNTLLYQKLPNKKLRIILQKIHLQAPLVMARLAPDGWKKTAYHKQLEKQQFAVYTNYVEELLLEKLLDKNKSPKYEEEFDYLVRCAVSYDQFFNFEYPDLNQGEQIVFAVLIRLLHDLTMDGYLVPTHTANDQLACKYYIDYPSLEKEAMKLAGHYDQIPQKIAEIYYLSDIQLEWEEMDYLFCMEILFDIIRAEGYQWVHYDIDLWGIVVSYRNYALIEENGLSYSEQLQQKEEVINTIEQILEPYKEYEIDPFDFNGIIRLFNRYKINNTVLAYLHSYGHFPEGYPYQQSNYVTNT